MAQDHISIRWGCGNEPIRPSEMPDLPCMGLPTSNGTFPNFHSRFQLYIPHLQGGDHAITYVLRTQAVIRSKLRSFRNLI